jgi:putative transposase
MSDRVYIPLPGIGALALDGAAYRAALAEGAKLGAPFVERLIGTLRREYLDQIFFWNGLDLHRKLDRFAAYYNQRRVHAGLSRRTPLEQCDTTACQPANLHHFAWRSDCSGLFHTPIAA